MSALTELLDELFADRDVDATSNARAAFLEIDRATFSKLINGQMPFTEKRAAEVARRLVRPDENQGILAERILAASRAAAPPLTVEAFFESVVDQGGSAPAGSITQLFKALTARGVDNALFCIEYRDIPRTSRGAKYADIAIGLGKAIADGLTVAMFMPFGVPEEAGAASRAHAKTPSQNTLGYMRRVRDECRDLYDLLLEEASKAAVQNPPEFSKKGYLRLYERNPKSPYLGSGLGAKFGYIQYDAEELGVKVRQQKVVQWISTPRHDLIVYRGETQIPPDAIRDSLYPIPHYFHLVTKETEPNRPRLPSASGESNDIDESVFEEVNSAWSEHHIPNGPHDYWQVYKG